MPETAVKINDQIVAELMKVGAHFGCSRSRRHPTVKPFIFGFKNRTSVINLEKTKEQLDRAMEAIHNLAKNRGVLLVVGTKKEAVAAIENEAAKVGLPYVTERWIGGTLTNFPQIQKRLRRLQELRERRETGELNHYPKKEQLRFAKEEADLERYFSGIQTLAKVPQAMLVVDSEKEKIAVAEARLLGLPVFSLSGADSDIKVVTYPIVANDSSQQTIAYILGKLIQAYAAGQLAVMAETPTETPRPEISQPANAS